MLRLLKKLWNWLRRYFFPTPELTVTPPPEPDDTEYENVLMGLLQEVAEGRTWGELQGYLISQKVNKDKLAQWLQQFGQRWLEQPEFHQELVRWLIVLGGVATGKLGEVAAELGESLQTATLQQSEEENRSSIEIYEINNNVDISEENSSLSLENHEINNNSDNFNTLLQQGIALSELELYEAAIDSYDKALKIKPDDYDTWYNRSVALHKLGRYEEANASYNKALELKPNYWNSQGLDYHIAWQGRGTALEKLEQYEEALAAYNKAIEIKPDDHDAWNNRGIKLCDDLGRYEEAIYSFDKSIEIKPDNYYAWYNRGIALRHLERYEEAILACDKAIEIKPDDHYTWDSRGVILCHFLERYEEAIYSFDKAIEIKPNDYQYWYNRGIALSNLGQYEEAIASFDKAIEIKPDDHIVWRSRGVVLCDDLRRYEEAIASFDKVIKIKPDDHIAWANRGFAAGQSRGYISFLHTQQLNPELNTRGYKGQLASYHAGLELIHQDTHPEGWGVLHHQIGKAQYFKGQQKTYSGLKSYLDFWRQAENSYKTALLTLQPPEFVELHLEVLKDLIRVLLKLEEIQEAQQLQRDGTEVLRRTLADPKRSEYSKRKLALKFSSFNQLTVDVKVQLGNLPEALKLAEEGKNICLRWLLRTEEIPETEYSQIQTFLKPTTAIVYWHLSPATLTTFVLLPNQPNPILIESATVPEENDQRPASLLQLLDWEDWLTAWNDNYKTYGASKDKQKTGKKGNGKKDHPWRTQMQKRLDSLGQILNIAAIEDTLHNHSIQNLILIPHRDLHRFPLHSLFENYTCTYLPSAYLALQQKPIDSQLSKLLIVENPKSQPDINGKLQKLEALPFAEVEAALIRQIYAQHTTIEDKNDQTQWITCEAVQAALSQPHDIFHFSGHGEYNSRNPAESCLFLSGTEQLTLLDIKDLDLSSYRLVCLAACETAVTGNQTITDEYVGLVSAFLKAGVTYVVSTLWTVESAATMLMMVKFHQNLQAEQPPTALKKAQIWLKNATREDLINFIQGAIAQLSEQKVSTSLLKLLKKEKSRISEIKENQPYCHPYYWAAFTISGLDQ